MLRDLVNNILVNALTGIASGLYSFRENLNTFIYSKVFLRNKVIRISFAGLLVLEKNGRYLLIRNIRRPENFGLIGGAYKYYDSAKGYLDNLGFNPETPRDKTMKNDLRGFVKGINLVKIINWFKSEKDRETNDCIHRELIEELKAFGISTKNIFKKPLSLRFLKEKIEHPYHIDLKNYYQFRILRYYEISDSCANKKNIIEFLFKQALKNSNLEIVKQSEILSGRTCKNSIIAPPTVYLFTNKKILGDGIPYL